jgi:5,10-methylenetetrahydromethanopterin reductase
MKIGVILDARSQASQLSEWGQVAEKYGLQCVWLSNVSVGKDDFVNLALLARDTKRILMGPTAISPFELHPLRMAMAILTLNDISKGRAAIVVGGGGEIARAMGVKTPPPNMVLSVKECIEIIKQISMGKKVNYDGSVFKIHSFTAEWAPKKDLIVYVGANRPKMIKMGCEVADGIMMTDTPIEYVNRIVAEIKKGMVYTGKTFSKFRINNFFAWHVKDKYEDAVGEARRYIAWREPWRDEKITEAIGLTHEESQIIKENRKKLIPGKEPEIPKKIVNKLIEGLTIISDTSNIEGCIDKLHAFEKEGLTEIALRLYGDPISAIKLLGEKILPEFKQNAS